jgi:hypothetical protein
MAEWPSASSARQGVSCSYERPARIPLAATNADGCSYRGLSRAVACYWTHGGMSGPLQARLSRTR